MSDPTPQEKKTMFIGALVIALLIAIPVAIYASSASEYIGVIITYPICVAMFYWKGIHDYKKRREDSQNKD